MVNDNRYLVFIALIILSSCNITKKVSNSDIVGNYYMGDHFELNSYIELFDDYSFEYRWQMGLLFGKTDGLWRLEGNNVILISNKQPLSEGTKKYEIVETEREMSDSVIIKIIDSNNNPIPFSSIILKLNSEVVTAEISNMEGVVILAKQKADEIAISALFFAPISHILDTNVSYYEFKLIEHDNYYRYFTNEIWKYKNKRLYDPSRKGHKYLKNYYLKEEKK